MSHVISSNTKYKKVAVCTSHLLARGRTNKVILYSLKEKLHSNVLTLMGLLQA